MHENFAVYSAVVLVAAVSCWTAAYANAPPGRYVLESPDVAKDLQTGLTWQRAPASDAFTAEQAMSHCSGLSLSGGGWRVPNIKELHTLVDTSRDNPPIDEVAFPATPTELFWSSTAHASITNTAWIVNFHYGDGGELDLKATAWVRCVR